MLTYNLMKCSDNYSKREKLWQYYRDEPANTIQDSESFKFKNKITGNALDHDDPKKFEMSVPVKYFSNFWRTLEIPFINCEIYLILSWSENCVISSAIGATKFAITDTKGYVPVVTLLT